MITDASLVLLVVIALAAYFVGQILAVVVAAIAWIVVGVCWIAGWLRGRFLARPRAPTG